MINTATIPWTIYSTTTGRDLVNNQCQYKHYHAFNWSMSQTGHDPHGYNPVNYQRQYTGRNLVCHVNRTLAIYWSMSQTGHDPHSYNPGNFHCHYTGHFCMPRSLASDPIRIQSCVCCLFWTKINSMAVTSIFLSFS